MNYQLKEIMRLYARDTFFHLAYRKNQFFNHAPTDSLILCNSFPKSGTHLLYQILYSLSTSKKWDDIVSVQALCGVMNTASHIRWKIGSAPPGAIVRSHLMCCDQITEILNEYRCRHLFIYRDLRDVAVSHARWVMKEPRFFLHKIYKKQSGFSENLMSSIRGVPIGTPFGSNVSQPNIGDDFRRWQGWLSQPNVLAIKFEDLVGERGGGSEQKRLELIEKIADYIGMSVSPASIASQFSSTQMNPQESHTFVKGGKGAIGGWQSVFSEEHKQAFKAVAGDLLIDLGYELDSNW